MSEAKFSPGPWRARPWSEVGDGEQPERTGEYFVHGQFADICFLAPHKVGEEDFTGADAHLIAAAPKMYNGLVDYESFLTILIGNPSISENKRLMAELIRLRTEVQSITAEARGESNQ